MRAISGCRNLRIARKRRRCYRATSFKTAHQFEWVYRRIAAGIGGAFVTLTIASLLLTGTAARAGLTRTDVNAKDARGLTPLERAVAQGDVNSVHALIQAGANVNARSSTGRTPLSWSAQSGQVEIVRALARAGADVNVKDKRGWTPLILASQVGNTAVVQALVGAGADTAVESPAGWNALMHASYFGRLETVHALIPAADVNYRSKSGITALMLARWACHLEIVNALSQAGAVSGPGEWRRPPQFEDFPVSRKYKGVSAAVDLRSNPRAWSYRTRLRQGTRKGPNFAGHYTVVSWGCGSNCESNAIVDALTGRVYDGIGDERGADFRLNSNLVIADPAFSSDSNAYSGDPTYSFPVRYYVWNGHKFNLIYEEACSVVNQHQKCGCEGLKEPPIQPGLK
jgi:hypothetical protein